MTRRRPRAGLRDRWVEHVVRADVGNACKVILLYFAQRMNDEGRVDVISRSDLSARLGVHEQRVAERIAEARAAGLLDLVPGSGVRGVRAQYVAVLGGMRTGERYPLRTAKPERIPTLSGTQLTGRNGQCVPLTGTHNARARIETQPAHVTAVHATSASNVTSDAKNGSDGRRDLGVVPLAALSPWARLAYPSIKVIAS